MFVWHNVKLGLLKNCGSFGAVMLSWTLIIFGKAPLPVRKWNSFGMSFSRKKTERIREEVLLHSRSPKILKHTHRRAGIHQTLAEGKGHNFPTLKYMDKVELLLKIVPMTNPIKFKKLRSVLLEAELLLTVITLCCAHHTPQSQQPLNIRPSSFSLQWHQTKKKTQWEWEKEITWWLLLNSQISKDTKYKIWRSKLSQYPKNPKEQYTSWTDLHFPTLSWMCSVSPGSDDTAKSKQRLFGAMPLQDEKCRMWLWSRKM